MFALTSKQEGSMSLRGFMQSGAWGRLHHFQLGGKARIIYQKKIFGLYSIQNSGVGPKKP